MGITVTGTPQVRAKWTPEALAARRVWCAVALLEREKDYVGALAQLETLLQAPRCLSRAACRRCEIYERKVPIGVTARARVRFRVRFTTARVPRCAWQPLVPSRMSYGWVGCHSARHAR